MARSDTPSPRACGVRGLSARPTRPPTGWFLSIRHLSAGHHGEPTNTTFLAILRVQFKGPQGPGSRQGPVFPHERRKRGRHGMAFLRVRFDPRWIRYPHDNAFAHANAASPHHGQFPLVCWQQKIIIARQAAAGLTSETSHWQTGGPRPRQPRFHQWARVARSRPRLAKFLTSLCLTLFSWLFTSSPARDISTMSAWRSHIFSHLPFSLQALWDQRWSGTFFVDYF